MDVIAQTDAFFAGKPGAWLVFETIKEKMIARWPQTQLRVMKTCIVFEDKKPYLYVSHPPRKGMRGVWLSISLRERGNHPGLPWWFRSTRDVLRHTYILKRRIRWMKR